jgi:hypothetical protein
MSLPFGLFFKMSSVYNFSVLLLCVQDVFFVPCFEISLSLSCTVPRCSDYVQVYRYIPFCLNFSPSSCFIPKYFYMVLITVYTSFMLVFLNICVIGLI